MADPEAALANYLDQRETRSPEAKLDAFLASKPPVEGKPEGGDPREKFYQGFTDWLTGGGLTSSLKKTVTERIPADIASKVKAANDLVTGNIPQPSPTDALSLSLPGGGTAVSRVGAMAMGKMMENPSADVVTNLKTAAKGAALPAALEVAVPVAGKVWRSLPGAKSRIAGQDAARVGEWMEKHTDLPAVRTAEEMRTMAAGPGLEAAGAAKEQRVGLIERLIGNQPLTITLPSGAQQMTLREANAELSRIGDMMRGIRPLDPRYKDIALKDAYGQVANDIRAGIAGYDPNVAAPLWDIAQEGYRKSRRALDLIRTPNAYRAYPNETQFNTPKLQERIAAPDQEARLTKAFGAQGFDELADALLRGGTLGTKDQLAWGQGRASDALRMLLEMRGGTPALLGAIPKTIAPNLTSRYTGRQPYSADATTQLLLDLAGQRATGGAR